VNGILNIHKPCGRTSFDVVAAVKRGSGERHTGHAGTLDPNASGVLPVCLGQSTRIIEYLMDTTKTYLAEIELGISTDTYDAEGMVIKTGDPSVVAFQSIQAVLEEFHGDIMQVPPKFSALKYRGKPMYHWARSGVEVERKCRRVIVHRLDILSWQPPVLIIRVVCGKGTYIRSLANDLGEKLGCGGSLKSLVREKYGPFDIKDAVPLNELEDAFRDNNWEHLLYPTDFILGHWKAAEFKETDIKKISNGEFVTLPEEFDPQRTGSAYCRAYVAGGPLLAVLHYDPQVDAWHPDKVFR